MQRFSRSFGFEQKVRQLTRGSYLLDLVLTDMKGVTCKVLQRIADHKAVEIQLKLKVPKSVEKISQSPLKTDDFGVLKQGVLEGSREGGWRVSRGSWRPQPPLMIVS